MSMHERVFAAPTCEPVRFVDLDRGQCKWCVEPAMSPAGPDMMCCGAPVIDRLAKDGSRKATHCQYHFERGGATHHYGRGGKK